MPRVQLQQRIFSSVIRAAIRVCLLKEQEYYYLGKMNTFAKLGSEYKLMFL